MNSEKINMRVIEGSLAAFLAEHERDKGDGVRLAMRFVIFYLGHHDPLTRSLYCTYNEEVTKKLIRGWLEAELHFDKLPRRLTSRCEWCDGSRHRLK